MSAEVQTMVLALAALLAGLALGWLHFTSLAWVTRLLVAGRLAGVALQLGRFVVLGLFLYLCAQGGWQVLLAGFVGIMAARLFVLRRPG